MSDLPDLVHQATLDTIERVRLKERERIIELLEDHNEETLHSLDILGQEARNYWQTQVRILEMKKAIELIKGETK